MSEAEAIDRLVLRVQKCRDLASALTSRTAADVLVRLAEQEEAGLRLFLAQRSDDRPS